KAELEAVLAAARKDIDTSWRTFQDGRAALAGVDCQAIAAETDLRRLNLDDLGVLLTILTGRCGGLVPPVSVTKGANGQPLPLAFANLRPTGLTLAHVALGHDVLKTQVLAYV